MSGRRTVSNYWQDVSGNTAIVFALLIPAIIGLIGGGMDYYVYSKDQKTLQTAADFAALAAAREAALQGWDADLAEAVAINMVETQIGATASRNNGQSTSGRATMVIDVVTREQDGTVNVTIEHDSRQYFLLGYFKPSPQISVSSEAMATGRNQNVCVIGLHGNREGAITLKQDATLTAASCSVYSNSGHRNAVKAIEDAVVMTQLTCSAGGYTGAFQNFKDETGLSGHFPLTDCPVVDDPLSERTAPRSSTLCNHVNRVINDGMEVLRPGVYCGGLGITGDAQVTLMPGIYVIKDGPFVASGLTRVSGTNTGFYFTGPNAVLEFIDESDISLEAPTTGPMAGILFMQDPNSIYFDDDDNAQFALDWNGKGLLPSATASASSGGEPTSTRAGGMISQTSSTVGGTLNALANRPNNWGDWPASLNDFRITSDNAKNLLGTIYAPRADFIVDAKQNVAEDSAYTALVVQRLILKDAPNLVLNTDYDTTTVPVPDGIGPTNPEVMLRR